jgi:hypothetical protein
MAVKSTNIVNTCTNLILSHTYKNKTYSYPGINLGGMYVALLVVIKVPADFDIFNYYEFHNFGTTKTPQTVKL